MTIKNFKNSSTIRANGDIFDATRMGSLWAVSRRTKFGGQMLTTKGFATREEAIEFVAACI